MGGIIELLRYKGNFIFKVLFSSLYLGFYLALRIKLIKAIRVKYLKKD